MSYIELFNMLTFKKKIAKNFTYEVFLDVKKVCLDINA